MTPLSFSLPVVRSSFHKSSSSVLPWEVMAATPIHSQGIQLRTVPRNGIVSGIFNSSFVDKNKTRILKKIPNTSSDFFCLLNYDRNSYVYNPIMSSVEFEDETAAL